MSDYNMSTKTGSYSPGSPLYSALPEVGKIPLHKEYRDWFESWRLIRDCLVGERAVKNQATRYLPKREAQTPAEYLDFLKSAVFFNAIDRSLRGILGTVFSAEPQLNSAPPKLKELYAQRTPMTNNALSLLEFLSKSVEELFTTGRIGILVDAPSGGGDPYLVMYRAEDILSWKTSIDPTTGKSYLSQVVLREIVEEDDESGLGTIEESRFRVLNLGIGLSQATLLPTKVYSQSVLTDEDVKSKESIAAALASNATVPTIRGMEVENIPFFFIGANNNLPEISKPPLLDIANLNISHFVSYALLEEGRKYTACPIYYATGNGMAEDNALAVGPRMLWKLDKDDRAGVIEFNGSGLMYLESALATKEQQIQILGGKLTSSQKRAAAMSIKQIERQEEADRAMNRSPIENFKIGMVNALKEWCKWYGIDAKQYADMSLTLMSAASKPEITAREIKSLQALYEAKVLPKDKMFELLKAAGIYPETFDMEEFNKLLEMKDQLPEPEPQLQLPLQGGRPPSLPSQKKLPPKKSSTENQ